MLTVFLCFWFGALLAGLATRPGFSESMFSSARHPVVFECPAGDGLILAAFAQMKLVFGRFYDSARFSVNLRAGRSCQTVFQEHRPFVDRVRLFHEPCVRFSHILFRGGCLPGNSDRSSVGAIGDDVVASYIAGRSRELHTPHSASARARRQGPGRMEPRGKRQKQSEIEGL
jgi:hypothetical protein